MAIFQNAFSELVKALCRDKATIFDDQDCTTWLIQAENGWQIAFMQFKQSTVSSEFHVNNLSQWGIVLNGEMSLWIPNKRKRTLKKGDTFFIQKDVPHRVAIKAGYEDITIFDGQRYKPQS